MSKKSAATSTLPFQKTALIYSIGLLEETERAVKGSGLELLQTDSNGHSLLVRNVREHNVEPSRQILEKLLAMLSDKTVTISLGLFSTVGTKTRPLTPEELAAVEKTLVDGALATKQEVEKAQQLGPDSSQLGLVNIFPKSIQEKTGLHSATSDKTTLYGHSGTRSQDGQYSDGYLEI